MLQYKPAPPNALKVGMQDTLTTFAAIIGIVIAITLVIMLIQTPSSQQNNGFWEVMALFAVIAVVGFVVAGVRATSRARNIQAMWERGVMETARVLSIKDVGFGRTRQRILRYSYAYNGKTYEKGTSVNRNWSAPGEELSILVDPQNPDDALLLFKYV
jgi:Na+/melibiose symporter-like transporter